MKTIEISGNYFELEDNLYKFLSNYIERLEAYVKKHGIDTESHQDILQRIADKLLEVKIKGDISQKDCINIVNQIGEPEDIFSDYHVKELEFTDNSTEKAPFFQRLYNAGWYRDTENTWLLGVCKIIGEKLGIPILLVRFLFVVMTPLIGFGISLYLILGLILPVKGADYKNSTILSYLGFQIFSLKDILINGISNIVKLIQFILVKVFKMSGTVAENIIAALRFVFFMVLALIFCMAIICLLIIAGAIFVGFNFNNIDFTGFLPGYTSVGLALAIVAGMILAIASFMGAFNKRIFHPYVIVSSIFMGVAAVFLFIATGYQSIKNFSYNYVSEQNIELQLSGGENNVILDMNNLNKNNHNPEIDRPVINFYVNTGNNIKLVVKNSFYTKDAATATNISSKLNELKYNKDGNIYNISNSGNSTFKELVPLSLLTRNIDIYIPIGVSMKISSYRYNYYMPNIISNPSKYSRYNNPSCYGSTIWYSSGNNGFVCERTDNNQYKYERRLYIENQLSDEIDTIIPIKHSTGYVEQNGYNNYESYGNYSIGNTWNLHSYNWSGENDVVVKVYDENVNIFVLLKINELEDGVEVLNKTVQKIEQKNQINFLNYDNIQAYSGLIVK